ncbi:hypothetical protein KY310_04855 [Candidatus Woesearchaeota archaeon]|nr:hypothetical protein [Candidatus Woesearchaeota archaeon]
MLPKRPTVLVMNKEKGERLVQELREDSGKNAFVCEVVANAMRACGISDGKIPQGMHSKVCKYICYADNIPEHDKPYAIAKVLYGTRI